MKKPFISLVLGLSVLALAIPSLAVECEGDPPTGNVDAILEYQKKCEEKIGELQVEQKTLKSALNLITSKINLTHAQIASTTKQINDLQDQIETLEVVIEDLDDELDLLTGVYVERVRQSYKNRHQDPLVLFLQSSSAKNFQASLRYLETSQRRDQIVIHELETARVDYDNQKTTKEEKQEEIAELKEQLQEQQQVLGVQQTQKNQLLAENQSSEKTYQDRLAKAVAELAAIESIIAGQGSEVEVGGVNVGDKIATIIPGASACSTGAHLHFEVAQDKAHQNPANYLGNANIVWNNQPDSPFGFGGSWPWPLNEPIRITQGYGNTAYSSRYANHVHTGIDMVDADKNYTVKAVRNGTLYRGSVPCGGGTLKYVHVSHSDDSLDTYYLHVNYF